MNPDEAAASAAGTPINVVELVQRLAPVLVSVPAAGDIVCARCRSSKNPGFTLCYQCQTHHNALGGFGIDVVPISMSVHTHRLHDHLRQYKDAPDGCVRYRLATALGGLLVTHVTNHGACLGGWDAVVTIPSIKHPHPHPLFELVGRIIPLRSQLVHALDPNPAWTGDQRQAGRQRFIVHDRALVRGLNVLLIDDTFTSGSSIQSAAYALAQAGAKTVIGVVIGCHIREDWSQSRTLLERLRQVPWHTSRCGICSPVLTDDPAAPFPW